MPTDVKGRPVDSSLIRGSAEEWATFDVPIDTAEDRIHIYGDRCMRWFGEHLEKQGFQVKLMSTPQKYDGQQPVDPDRKRYIIWANVTRRPVVHTIDVPDMSIPAMQRLGMKLV